MRIVVPSDKEIEVIITQIVLTGAINRNSLVDQDVKVLKAYNLSREEAYHIVSLIYPTFGLELPHVLINCFRSRWDAVPAETDLVY